ncbi:hypothetical protein [Streptomyces sp. CdTB01]|uniref:hypothetical protein n=1 Tax=Streptomyces sp. CdTB01 TaxID=1725411 RepID=UPI00073AC380|nr:hypothetical protein [Streptomyces sp. CdTB01]ALV30709.1 hypothetical protein AS200_00280 [Streptomyces sp. CdTB01]
MRYTVWDRHSVHAFQRAGLTQQQRSLLEGLLRALEHGAYFSDHVSAANSAFLAVTRASEGLAGNAVGQPRLSLTRTLLRTSLAGITAAGAAFAVGGAADLAAARAVVQDAERRLDRRTTVQTKQLWVHQLQAHARSLESAVRDWVTPLWEGPSLSAEVLAQARAELAVAVALTGRDGRMLQEELLRVLSRGKPGAAALSALLWPTPSDYRVAVLVEGTQQLERLELLLPTARQWPVTGSVPYRDGYAPAGRGGVQSVRDAVTLANQARRPGTVVEVRVSAADAATALRHGRRQISEALDQYAAAQRLVDFSLSSRSLVTDKDGVRYAGDPLVTSVRSARPLTSHWPAALRPALRSAHLAAQADAPMTSAALAWSAFDSLGLESSELDVLARACALQTLRQQVVSLYHVLTESALARLKHARWELSEAERALGIAERAVQRTREHTSKPVQDRSVELQRRAEQQRAHAQQCAQAASQLEAQLLPLVADLQHYLLGRDLSAQPLQLTSRLLNLDAWQDLLLPLEPDADAALIAAHEAATRFAAVAGGLAADNLALWRARLATPGALAAWLNDQEGIFQGLLAWLYATRNLAFHSGQFTGTADTLTAHAARSVVDMTLEFLGNWHQTQEQRGQQGSDALTVLRELARRKDDLVHQLGRASSCRAVNILNITAVDSNAFDRS